MGSTHRSNTGVKQGCPLSPILFGFLMDGLSRYLDHHHSDLGCTLQGLRVQCLMYADDVVLLATCPSSLQCLMDATLRFLCQIGLPVNPHKTHIVCFLHALRAGPWHCHGYNLSPTTNIKYLGLHLSSSHGVFATFTSRKKHVACLGDLKAQLYSFELQLISRTASQVIHNLRSTSCKLWVQNMGSARAFGATWNTEKSLTNSTRQAYWATIGFFKQSVFEQYLLSTDLLIVQEGHSREFRHVQWISMWVAAWFWEDATQYRNAFIGAPSCLPSNRYGACSNLRVS